MNRTNLGAMSNIVIDYCNGHGAWFEHGERDAVLQFIASGGLELQQDFDATSAEATRAAVGMTLPGQRKNSGTAKTRVVTEIAQQDAIADAVRGVRDTFAESARLA